MTHTIDTAAYLARIGYDGAREPTVETLKTLQHAHLLAVPFENLDIHPPFRREIVLDVARLEMKIVGERRGGFCYELNGLYGALLDALGFQVTMLSAGVRRKEGGFGPEFDHLLLRVDIDGEPWLADVGFGDLFLEPIRLVDAEQRDVNGSLFRIDREGDARVLRGLKSGRGEWEPQYRFTLTPRVLDEYAQMCHFQQTSPDSAFTHGRVCSRFTPTGRISLSDTRLMVTERGERSEQPIADEGAFLHALHEHFGIALHQDI